jgi:plasmid replication initiation protein
MGNEKHTIIKANALIEGRHEFTLLEIKLFLSVVVQIKRGDKYFQPYRVHIREFLDSMGVKGNVYERIRKLAIGIKDKKSLVIETDTGHLITSYLSDIEIYRNEGYIDCFVSPKLRPFLLQLKKNFTVYDIRNVINCKSVYSIRIYQLLKQYEKIGSRKITLAELRIMLGMPPDLYARWGNLKTRVIEVAKKELKKNSDLYFSYTTKRKGRVIDSIRFKMKKQQQRRLDFDGEGSNGKDTVDYFVKDATGKVKQLQDDFENGVSYKDFSEG